LRRPFHAGFAFGRQPQVAYLAVHVNSFFDECWL
jgi:hypothetical protein